VVGWRSCTFFSSYFSFALIAMTCAVPVLPPLVYWAPAKARAPVPSLFTPAIARRMNSRFSSFSGMRRTSCGSMLRCSPVRRLSTCETRCGRYTLPPAAIAATACASWIGV
jgi:hypothetical protein